MKILIITNMYPSPKKPFYGAFVREQVECLKNLGHSIKVIGDQGEGNGIFQLLKKYSLIGIKSLLFSVVEKPDIIHAHYIFPTGFIGWICSFLTRVPLFITSHRGDVFDMPYIHPIFFKLTRFCLQKANRIVAVSTEIKHKMVGDFGINPIKISIIDMGVGLPNAKNIEYSKEKSAKKKEIKVLFVAISFARKGGYILIDAAEKLQQINKGKLHYEIIGEKPHDIVSLIERKGLKDQINFIGLIPHKHVLERMKKADIFVLPSSSEGLPIAMLEAMACGTGVIITPVGDVTKVINDKENGLLIPVGDHHALANAIDLLVNDGVLLEKIGRNAIKTAKNYSSSKKARELTELYSVCLK